MRIRLFGFLVFWLALGGGGHAAEPKRVALVIGNNSYPHFDADHQLKKAVNDAMAVGDALERDGFAVIRGTDLSRGAMVDKLYDLTSRIQPGDTAFVYFAGHGVALGSGNYLLPSDVPEAGAGQEARIASQSLAEADVIATLKEKGARIAIVVLDACRDNPFKRPGVRSAGLERGLARAQEVSGVFSLYSAGFGQSALDRLGDDDPNPNSVFTRVLVPLLTKPGLNLDDLAYEVRENVVQLASSVPGDHEQVPAAYDQIVGGRVYLAGPPPEVPAGAGTGADEIAWSFIETNGGPKQVRAFMERFPQSALLPKAEARLAALRSAQLAALPKAVDPGEGSRADGLSSGDGKTARIGVGADSVVGECDRLAGSPDDSGPTRVVGIPVNAIDPGRAVPACRAAHTAHPEDLRITFELGRALDKAGDAEAALLYRIVAEAGDPRGMNNLGSVYERGDVIAKNDAEAVRWYRKAADAGYAPGMSNLGFMYERGLGVAKDEAEAVRWFRKAAEGGNGLGMNSLGRMYHRGVGGVAKDDAEAVRWYRKSAAAGEVFAMSNLGWMYANGAGVVKDGQEAARWYRKAGDAGYAPSMNILGLMYFNGDGIAKEEAEAVIWFRKAAAAGFAPGMNNLGLAFQKSSGSTRDDAEALRWFRKAAQAGDVHGMMNAALMYRDGAGVARDQAEAANWFRKAADSGDANGMVALGSLYEHGSGVPGDEAEAVRWYRRAADAGNARAMSNLGFMFENGLGVTKSLSEAFRWYLKSAQAGDVDGRSGAARVVGKQSATRLPRR